MGEEQAALAAPLTSAQLSPRPQSLTYFVQTNLMYIAIVKRRVETFSVETFSVERNRSIAMNRKKRKDDNNSNVESKGGASIL